MKMSERTLRISAASVLALVMVSGSYMLSGPNFLSSRFADASSTDELLKAYALKDTDADGLPDWQESLYGTDPSKAISNTFGIPDGQAAKEGKLSPNSLASQLPSAQQGTTTTADLLADVPGLDPAPGSITEQFSHEFFQQYIETSKGQPLSAEQQQALIDKLLVSYNAKVAAKVTSKYTQVSVHPDSSVTSAAYAGQIEDLLNKRIPTEDNDVIVLMQALIQKDDETAIPKLDQLHDAYAQITADLLVIHVPPQLVPAHLELIQSSDEVAKAIELVEGYKTDPIATLGAIPTFDPSRTGIINSLQTIATAVVANGEPAPGSPGAYLVQLVRSAQSQ